VREQGIPIHTYAVKSTATGRDIAAYQFGDPEDIKFGRIGGRKSFPKKFKARLVERYESQDAFTGETLHPRYLQIDHRIPYEVAGEKGHELDEIEEFMLIDSSGQRAKSWSCEQCENWRFIKDEAICRKCFWAFPENYEHVAGEPVRRVDIEWRGRTEVAAFERLRKRAEADDLTVAALLKKISHT